MKKQLISGCKKYKVCDRSEGDRELLRLRERIRNLLVAVDGAEHDETRPAQNGEAKIASLRRIEWLAGRGICLYEW